MPKDRGGQPAESATWNTDVNPAVEGDQFVVIGIMNLVVKVARRIRSRFTRTGPLTSDR